MTATSVDERNLTKCKYLSYNMASTITHIDTIFLFNIIILVLSNTSITFINTVPLTKLVQLYARDSKLTVLDATNLV